MPDAVVDGVRVQVRSCPICEAPSAGAPVLPYGRPPWDIVRCPACGFAYVPVVPVHEELVETLSWDRRHGEEATRRRREHPIVEYLDKTTRWRLYLLPRTEPVEIMNRIGPASGVVVDLGCGDGVMLGRIDRRFTACGVEVSAVLAARAGAVVAASGGTVVQATAAEGLATFADRSLAGVVLRSFLEHDADARAVVLAVGRKLRPDGVAVVKVPNYGSINRRVMGRAWCGFRLPDHVNYFTRGSLARLAADSGLAASFPFWLSLPTDDNIVAILRPVAS